MSEIIGMVGMSHSPFATMLQPRDATAPGGRFLADAARVAAAVAALAPDALVGPGDGRVRRGHAVISAAVIGSGNIGTDLMIKLLRAAPCEVARGTPPAPRDQAILSSGQVKGQFSLIVCLPSICGSPVSRPLSTEIAPPLREPS